MADTEEKIVYRLLADKKGVENGSNPMSRGRALGKICPTSQRSILHSPPRTIDYSKDAPNEVNVNTVGRELSPLITGSILC